ncbi:MULTISPECIES: TetR/AcrR family transcriptional regulator [unclassified Mycobacterium]|uniref:TetR/AcrR family transcriptional regulator n=1 Tax=unclassified Mycobacterium TaxID=2642494 RepID=UPI0029C60E1D|nr:MULTISPECIES: TetR/AcrR family transcriptional regulator [unclassified Mycobacterium]
MSERASRPHSGRRRNEDARRAILDAAFSLLQEAGGPGVTVQGTAAAAGVGRQTIYRWWPNRGALIAEALAERARTVVAIPDTGSFRDDLVGFLTASFADAVDNAQTLRQFMALAQQDPELAAVAPDFAVSRQAPLRALLERGRARGALSSVIDIDVLADVAYGFLWNRLLLGHASLDRDAAEKLGDALMAVGSQQA